MSIEHILYFKSKRTRQEISALIKENIAEFKPVEFEELKTEAYLLKVYETTENRRNSFSENYGFAPDLRAVFYQNSDENIEAGDRTAGKAIALILKEEGDAVFFYVIDTPILKRNDENIWISDDKSFDWLRSALDEIRLKYELKPPEWFWNNKTI